jgi:uncharacterized membrane protein
MKEKSRIQYLDWLRGLAVVLMIQTHTADSFLRQELRSTAWYQWSQFVGGWGAPLFLFLAGVSLGIVFDRARARGANTRELLEKAVKRGVAILLLAFAFRIEQVLVWFPFAPWRDVLKVDILNCIGVSYVLVGLAAARRKPWILIAIAAGIVLLTPLIAPFRGGILLDYLNGNGNGVYFPIFPWAAYTFAGAGTAYLLMNARGKEQEHGFLLGIAVVGLALLLLANWINQRPERLFGLADYSRYSPHYAMTKFGCVLLMMYAAFGWARRPTSNRWSPMLIFGQTSLLVYWLHIEFVYGRLRFFTNSLGLTATAMQLLWLLPLMLVIAVARLRFKARKVQAVAA